MKRILAMLLALVLVFAFTACGDENSVEVNSLTPDAALKKYVTDVYTANGFGMDVVMDYDGAQSNIKYAVTSPFDNSRIQYTYESDAVTAALVSEIVEGAKLNFFYTTDDAGKKIADQIPTNQLATNADIRPFILSRLLFVNGSAFEGADSVTMDFIGDGNMTFTASNAASSLISGYKDIFPMPEDGDRKAYEEEIKAINYNFVIENNVLVSVTISGSVNGKPLSITATNFTVIDAGTQVGLADADSYEKIVTQEEIEAAKKAAEEAAAAEAAAEAAAAEASETTETAE